MRKLAFAVAAFGALGIAMPAALADTVVIHKHRDHVMVPPPPVVVHPHDNSKTVIIKHHDND
jgi:hypothetical protein